MTTNIFHKSFCLAMKAVSNINHNQLIAVNNFILDNFQKVTSVEDKFSILKIKLANFLHAYHCGKKTKSDNKNEKENCNFSLCHNIKKMWDHLKLCTEGYSCAVAFCLPTKKLLIHWSSCHQNDCSVCDPFPNQYAELNICESPVKRNIKNTFQYNKIIKPKCQKFWSREEMIEAFMPQLNRLFVFEKESEPFMRPVDPEQDLCPDYFKIIRRPMDFKTIMTRMVDGGYTEPWQLVNDVYLVFGNAWLYNKKCSIFHKYACKLADVFEANIDAVMKKLGFCCGQRYECTPLTKYCDSRNCCNIPVLADYYQFNDMYAFCEACFNESPGSPTVSIFTDQPDPLIVEKAEFEKKKNLERKLERFIACSYCGRQNHVVCVMYPEEIDTPPFICHSCRLTPPTSSLSPPTYQPVIYRARDLPTCKLSDFIESRVRKVFVGDGKGNGGVVVRVVSSAKQHTELKPLFKKYFPHMPKTFPCTSKVIFVFQQVKQSSEQTTCKTKNNKNNPSDLAADQDTNSSACTTNDKTNNSKNSDSNNNNIKVDDDENDNNEKLDVCFFGMHVQEYGCEVEAPNCRKVYLAYVDSLKYVHPPHLRTAVYHSIILSYMLYIKQLGYVSLHIWSCPPSEGDDYIFNCHPRYQKIPKAKRLNEWYKRLLEKAQQDNVIESFTDILTYASDNNITNPTQMPYFSGDFWPSSLEEHINSVHKHLGGDIQSELLTNKMYETLSKFKEMFFVVTLNDDYPTSPIIDQDSIAKNDVLQERFTFLSAARQRQVEFSSLRRAKHSTQFILRQLFKDDQCTQHTDNKNAIFMLEHSSKCQGGCELEGCELFKRAIEHTTVCKKRLDCQSCRSLVSVVLLHARRCRVDGGNLSEKNQGIDDTSTSDKIPSAPPKKLKIDEALKKPCSVKFCSFAKKELERLDVQEKKMSERLVIRRTAMMMGNNVDSPEDHVEDYGRMGSM